MTRWSVRLVVGLLFLAAATPLLAQTFHGGLRGLVREQGAVVPGAGVDLINEATNVSRHTQTNNVGEYAFINVDPGTYTVKATMQGFKTIENKGVRIGTQQFVTLDFTLEVGSLQEAVTVESQASPLETSNASVGSTLDSATLQTLPTAGRNPFFLSTITPGVTHTGDPQFIRQQDQTNSSLLSLGGGPRRGNNYTLDGVAIVDMRNRATVIPSIEAVEEVKVQVTTYDAEMGRTGGGVFNMTGKSGANAWHGSLLGQNRPGKARSLSFFARKACDDGSGSCDKPDTYFYLYAGSIGGPIRKDKTFFWASFEGYKTNTIDDAVVRAPSERELSGDFSQSGITVYDPLTTRPDPNNPGQFIRTPFPGNVIPANRISPVAKAMRQYWPQAGPASAELVDRSITGTFKLDQLWTQNFRTSAMYAVYDSKEPQPRSYLKDGKTQDFGANPADPGDGALLRQVHAIAVNNTITPNATTVAHVRLGYTSFADDCVPNEFDPGTLGFAPSFVSQVPAKKFPYFLIGTYGTDYNGYMFGDRPINDLTYYSWDANASMSKLLGRHTVKFGASYRKIGVKNFNPSQSSGRYFFDGQFTSADPLNPDDSDPHSLAAFLLGYPSDGFITVARPTNAFIDYYAGYAQDDFRVSPNFTVNLGLRYEFEQGLQEKNNELTVGFDRDRAWPIQVPGLALKGGLMYAGVDGYPTHQSDPSKTKFAPRVGFAWSVDPKTVVRGGYGLFWAPHQYPGIGATSLGTRGFTAQTDYVASTDGGLRPCPTCSIVNPFPFALAQPTGSADGILTGAGGSVDFIDQFRKSARVHQYSIDFQRELPGRVVAGIGYIGATSRHLGVGGNDDGTVNINQLDPRFQALGSALLDPVPNPFFGNPAFGAFADQPTIPRGQLLRPYPQFGDVLAHQVSAGRAQYHSLVLRLERPITNGWGGRINYTLSSNKNNIFGELNQFSNNSTGVARILNSYDIDAEYAHSITEQPHRLNFALTAELPFGKGKSRLSDPGLARVLFGGWAITGVGYFQSGFPVAVIQSTNTTQAFSRVQRPNTTGTSPATSGGTEGHYDPECGCINNWFNSAAWSAAPAFTFGNAPRTDTRMRTPFKTQTDVAFQKTEPIGGGALMIRAEIINVFNNTQFNGPNVTFGSSSFGRISSTRGFPRMLQIMARFSF
jgi:hypothetical protein